MKKLYWGLCLLAFVLSAFFAPKYVEYEWGVGAYLAIAWAIFIVIFGIVSFYAPQIKKFLQDNK